MVRIKHVAVFAVALALVITALPQSAEASGRKHDGGNGKKYGHEQREERKHDREKSENKRYAKDSKWDHHKHDHSYMENDERHKNGNHVDKHGKGHYKHRDHDKKDHGHAKKKDCEKSDKQTGGKGGNVSIPDQPEEKSEKKTVATTEKPAIGKGAIESTETPEELPNTGGGLLASFLYSMGAGAAIQGYRSRRKA